jgi:UDP-3-O-[3-hydroxymyristoyl] glucosamine N-acyltransferase
VEIVMEWTLQKLAELVGGVVPGNGDPPIHDAQPLVDALPGTITLLDSPKNLATLQSRTPAAVVVREPLESAPCDQLIVSDPYAAFSKIVALFRPTQLVASPGIDRRAVVDASATIGKDCWIAATATVGPDCVVGDRVRIHPGVHLMAGSTVGEDTELFPHVVVYPDTRIGARVRVHAGAVLGADGFGYATRGGQHHLSTQLGYVIIENDVDIGANTTIDRGTFGATRIGEGTKIDNLVMIAHNCKIGKHNLICSQVGVAGSSSTGDYVVLAGQVGMRDHVHIGDRTVVCAQAGVAGDIPPDSMVGGSPAIPQKHYLQSVLMLSRLPEMRDQLRQLTHRLAAWEATGSPAAADDGSEGTKSPRRAA